VKHGAWGILGLAVAATCWGADNVNDAKFPLGPQLRVLAEDAESPAYRELVGKMLLTDLAAEWQRVETVDNAESFLRAHGGLEHVASDPALQRAYRRRLEIREKFLDVMRAGFARFKRTPPFDRGKQAEKAGTFQSDLKAAAVALSVVTSAPGAERQWARFRGPGGQGRTRAVGLPLEWDQQRNVVWRRELSGQGNSSPVIWGNRIFLTSAQDKGLHREVVAIDRESGEVLWTRAFDSPQRDAMVRPKNGYASATPVVDGERLIAFLGSAGIVCLDLDGTVLWHHELPPFRILHGPAASGVLYKDRVIFIQDQSSADSIMIALDKRTGKLLWQRSRTRAMGWSTPVVVRVGDHDELIYPGNRTVKGYDPRSGEELWSLGGPTREVVPSIVVGTDLIYSASGRNGPTLALRPGGRGDVTATHLAWRAVRGGPHVPSPVFYERRLYTVNDTGIATCLDAESGKLVWQKRIRDRFSASPLEAEGRLYCASESGVVYVLATGEQFKVLAQNDLGSPILASPAALDGRLFIRTAEALYSIADLDAASR